MKIYSRILFFCFVGTVSFAQDFKTYSKFDFVSGEKVVAFEDFAQAAIGDFPVRWNSNGSGEIITIEGQQGKWLQLNNETSIFPEFIKNLPENFTMEFNLAANPDPMYKYTLHQFNIIFTPESDPAKIFRFSNSGMGASNVVFNLYPSKIKAYSSIKVLDAGRKTILRNTSDTEKFSLPQKPFDDEAVYKKVIFVSNSYGNGPYYLSNLRWAEGAPDTRNKLITEGKFVTTGILFDVNSDKIKGESYGVLKQIADALQENANVKIRIVGHTDSDGDDAKNLELSKRRAAAVKNNLVTEFGIDAARIQTDGKGETQPAMPNTTPEGKANNRRVEFVKL